MQLKVNNCGECPLYDSILINCKNSERKEYFDIIDINIIHPCCPEGGAFEIKTSPTTIQIKEDESK